MSAGAADEEVLDVAERGFPTGARTELFAGTGEVRELARTLDWGATALGWPDRWSPALRIATRAMLDSPVPICLWSGLEYAAVYNDAYRRILAAKHPAALGQPGAVVWAEVWDVIEAQFDQVRGGGLPIARENARFTLARLEGGGTEDAWFSYSLSALRDEDGTVAGVLNISPETTSSVLAERELEVQRARLEDVFRRAPSFITAFRGTEQVYEFVNDAYYQLVGYREIIGRPLLEAIPEVRGQGYYEVLEHVRTTGEAWVGREAPVVLQRSPGATPETRYLDMVFQSVVDAEGTRTGVVVHGSDITEQVLARREVERARDRANRLQALTAALAATTRPEEIADVVVAQGVDAADAATGMLVLRVPPPSGEGDDELVILRQTGLAATLATAYARFPLSSPVPTALCARTNEPFFLADREALATAFPELTGVWDARRTQALAAVPLSVGGEVVGAMTFTFTAPRPFPAEDRDFFLTLGGQAAQALERARLFEAEHTARIRTETLQRVTAALAKAQSLADVGRVFSRELTTLLGAQTAWVGVVTPDGAAIEAQGWSGYADGMADAWRHLALDANIALTDAVRSGVPQWWPTRDALARAYPARAEAIRTLAQDGVAVLPILGDDTQDVAGAPAGDDDRSTIAVGGIVVGFASPQRFDADTRAFFLALAQQCAQAVARARSYQSAQEARLEAEAARRAAEAANRAKSEFLAVMSHELRTPLNAIGGYTELIELGIHGDVTDAQRTALARIQASQRHLLGLIAGVLDYSRVEAGAVTYRLIDLPVAEAVAEAEALVAPQLRANGLGYVWSGAPPGLTVRADREKLQQILLNLLSNAVKFTSARDDVPGRIEVACSVEDAELASPARERVLLHIRDTGSGIAPDKLDAVFEPFVQVDQRLTRPHQGTGLGLAISRDLARGMGGDLTVESQVGAGSTFTLALPRR
jgi:PAS domain S-box-containing protein